MNYRKSPLAHALALLVLLPCSQQVLAQQSTLAIEEILVTARTRQENLQEVPIAISAINEETIARAGIERAADYVGLLPNVTLVDTANVGDTQLGIRGIISTRDAESTFAYVVDGVLSTNPNSFNEELFDVQQIEVLKGPQGALYGRNAVAGAILVTTKEPSNEFEGRVSTTVGNVGTFRANATISGPLVEDTLFGRLAVSTRRTDGFYKNIFTNEDDAVDYLEDTSIRSRLKWIVNDDLTLDFRGGYSEVSGGAINFNATFAIPAFVSTFGAPNYFQDPNSADLRFAFNTPGENDQETLDLTLKADWNLGFADLIANIAYNDLQEYLLSDGTAASFYGYEVTPACQAGRGELNSFTRTDLFGEPFNPFGVLPPGQDFMGVYGPYTPLTCDGYQYQERNQQDFSIDARLVSDENQAVRWIAGVYFADIERETLVSYGADQGQGYLRQPYVDPTGPNPTDLLFWDDYFTSVFAGYGQVEFDIDDNMEVFFALRYDREEREVSNRVPNVSSSGQNVNLLDSVTFAPMPINPAFASNPAGIPDRDRNFHQFQPKLTWSWLPTDDMTVYASFGVGFRSGGFNAIGTEDLTNFWFNAGFGGPGEAVGAGISVTDEYDKEVSRAYEVGLKSEWMQRRLRLNLAGFRTDIENNQFFEFFAGPFGILRTVTTIDQLYIQGLEADFTLLATDYLSLYGGLGLMESEIEVNRNRPLSVGNDVPQTPELTGNLGAELVFPLGGDLRLVSRLDWTYTGEMWFHTLQGEQTPTIWNAFFGPGFNQDFSQSARDAFDLLDLRIGVETERWALTAWGRNLTDEQYLQEIIPAPEFGGSFIHPSALRGYGVDFRYNF
ncbi:MAG: TonB-dependent receptor [Gammaproteobacteria bacterium]|nr:TonB-dependent receptor [Gammaproteobacteria bacterium]